jgi:hypothetical protein
VNVEIPEVFAAITADSTALGVITIASTANVFVGAICQISKADGSKADQIQVVKVLTATTLQARICSDQNGARNYTGNYGFSNLSAYTLATSCVFEQNAQIVRVEPTNTQIPSMAPQG